MQGKPWNMWQWKGTFETLRTKQQQTSGNSSRAKMTYRRVSPHSFSSFSPQQLPLLPAVAVVPQLPFFLPSLSCSSKSWREGYKKKECGVRNRRSSLHPFPPNGPCPPTQNLRSLTQNQNNVPLDETFSQRWSISFLFDYIKQLYFRSRVMFLRHVLLPSKGGVIWENCRKKSK